MKRLFTIIPILAVLAGCGTLDPAGVYQGNKELYAGDLSIDTPYTLIRTFLSWELANRTMLAKYPEVTKAADQLRIKAPPMFKAAVACRDVWKASPTEPNRTAWQNAIETLQVASDEAVRIMTETSRKE